MNTGFTLAADKHHKVIISMVGNRWQKVLAEPNGDIAEDTLYQTDHSHPTIQGSFFSALILIHDMLKVDLEPLKNRPGEITANQFQLMKKVLVK